jgi:two-component system, cell cycle sensor histidine kinase and response regulator CckA
MFGITSDQRPETDRWQQVTELATRALAGLPVATTRREAAELSRTLGDTSPEDSARLLDALARVVADAARREESDARGAMLFERAPVCIQSIDVTARITTMNETGRQMFPAAAPRLPGLSFLELVVEDQRAEVAAALTRALEGAECEFSFDGHDGKSLVARFIPVISGDGTVTSLIGVTNDVTARLRAEETVRERDAQLRQLQKMEAVGRLAGGIAHDFNNLLTVITGYADFALAGIDSGDVHRSDLEEIRNAADRASALTRQLLSFSRQQMLEPAIFDLGTVAAGMETMLRRLIGEDVELVTIVGEGVVGKGDARVYADPHQVEQVILNLALNARDAMPLGGKLTIEVANVDLDEQYCAQHVNASPGRHVMLAVTDAGVGMDEETLSRVFEPFFTTKEPGKGTGLGLATVYGIVEQSGGSVEVYSEVGRGTCFKVYLPQVEEDAVSAEPAEQVDALGDETILLVEDDAAVRALVHTTLDRRGYRVLEAEGPHDAFRLCIEHGDAIDLVLSDVVMPGMSGVDLIARAATLQPQLRALLMSGYPDEAVVRHGLIDGEVAFIGKPFTADVLARKVRDVLDGSNAVEAGR